MYQVCYTWDGQTMYILEVKRVDMLISYTYKIGHNIIYSDVAFRSSFQITSGIPFLRIYMLIQKSQWSNVIDGLKSWSLSHHVSCRK